MNPWPTSRSRPYIPFFSSTQPFFQFKSPTRKFGNPIYVIPFSSPRRIQCASAPDPVGNTLYTPRPTSSRSPPRLLI